MSALSTTRSLSFVCVAALILGCSDRQSPSPPIPASVSPYPELGIEASNYPRVDGSTSTLPIQRIVTCKVLDALYEWRHSAEDDTRSVVASDNLEQIRNPDYRAEKRELCNFINRITKHAGTHEAYVNLIRD